MSAAVTTLPPGFAPLNWPVELGGANRGVTIRLVFFPHAGDSPACVIATVTAWPLAGFVVSVHSRTVRIRPHETAYAALDLGGVVDAAHIPISRCELAQIRAAIIASGIEHSERLGEDVS